MKPRFIFWTLSLVVVLLAVSCAPAAPVSTEAVAPETAVPVEQAPATEAAALPTEAAADPATEVPAVQAVATSRGPDLHATDPATVSLASGQLQLVEFFRFT